MDRIITNYNIRAFIIFMMILALSDAISNAFISISLGLGIIYILYDLYKKKNLHNFMMPSLVRNCIFSFFTSVIVASIFTYNFENIDYAIKYIYWFLPFPILFYLSKDGISDKIIIYPIILSIICTSLYSLYLFFTLPAGSRIGGFHFNPNFYAVMLIMLIPFVLFYTFSIMKNNKFERIIGIVTVFLGCFSLYLTGSRGGVLAFILSCIIIIVLYFVYNKNLKRMMFLIFLVMLIVGIAMNVGFNGGIFRSYDMERIYLLESSYNMWCDYKLFGAGLANWDDLYQNKYVLPEANEKLIIPHNIVAWFFSATGIIGGFGFLILISGLLYFFIKHAFKGKYNYLYWAMIFAMFSVTIHGLVDVGITMKASNRLFWALLGISTASFYWNKENKQN